jgi:uncharacterized membrane protein YoaK (UPF0700 family)
MGCLTLNHLFTAHMSGNTDAFGVALGQAHLAILGERGIPIGLFVLGIALGTAVVELEERRAVRHPFIALYGLEVLLPGMSWGLSGMWAPTGSIGASRVGNLSRWPRS